MPRYWLYFITLLREAGLSCTLWLQPTEEWSRASSILSSLSAMEKKHTGTGEESPESNKGCKGDYEDWSSINMQTTPQEVHNTSSRHHSGHTLLWPKQWTYQQSGQSDYTHHMLPQQLLFYQSDWWQKTKLKHTQIYFVQYISSFKCNTGFAVIYLFITRHSVN